MKIRKVGVVGCGFMGAGIVQVCAQSGYEVVVTDISEQILSKGMVTIEYYLNRGVEKGRISQQDRDLTVSRIKRSLAQEDLNDRDLVIEAVPEDMELKRRVFVGLDEICPTHTILCSNTSCLPITELARATRRPDRVIGTHFLSPVPPSKLLEIVKADTTSDETLATVKEFGRSLRKEILVAKDTPGFIFNYLLLALTGAAVRLLEDGVASAEDIDKSMTLGLGHPIGPLALADFNGLDVGYMVSCAMYERSNDPCLAPSAMMKEMVDAGHLGRKTGQGFYKY
ncbi:MAG: 3-hydroxyacyl-CoA dehydrogenase family protein [Dehalococcoidia bacterium]|nr:3-hydroxyacyl-CoA dehydrogenase family protein [Dehalococcoidia bacterium]MDH4300082.1 3-hydroxyacyl-CoA dehydrogenase family protein [Dehalococcoidia bacterium]MDH4367122.1 3-hydroxyacyl-CoA dehydrogenase family protein [Dehalococcoidia bacterium]